VLLGVVSFDILPEIFDLTRSERIEATGPMLGLVAGFLLFHSLEKLMLVHHGQEEAYAPHHHPHVGVLSALALAGHSFMDGVGIGLAFHVSKPVGIGVAIAVISHDFCDGLNTVSLMLLHRSSTRRAFGFLILDALAPILGAAATLLFHLPPAVLAVYLGFFAGFLLYIAVSDILPEAHSRSRSAVTMGLIGLTCLGVAFIYMVVRLTA
jgi:ZIP family zinc transporter